MKQNNIYVDIHVLQTVPPSCVNRDDTGSPKTAVYGGVTRARVSSQSWKHAMREYFKEEAVESFRTKKVIDLLAAKISRDTGKSEEDAKKLAKDTFKAAGIKIDEKKNETGALFFIGDGQLEELCKIAFEHSDGKYEKDDKKVLQEALKSRPAIDIAFFGRMVADDPSLNFDAACQVAHAISTHAVHNEYDYFTAVDDCSPADNAGAGHLGTVEYNSATLYRYATINISELNCHLAADMPKAVSKFVAAFVNSMPTGKQNTFANRTVPDAVYLTIRRDQPVNMAGAFEKAVKAGNNGYVEASVKELFTYASDSYDNFVLQPEKEVVVGKGVEQFSNAEKMSLSELLANLEVWMNDYVSEVEK